MFSQRIFAQRFGDPASFEFKQQVWDTRLPDASPGDKQCAVCRRRIRFVFILKHVQTADPLANPEDRKLEIGRCCFHYFRKWHPKLADELYHALECARNLEKAVKRDKKRFGDWTELKVRAKTWGSLQRQASKRLKELQKRNAAAPVGTVMGLLQTAGLKPRSRRQYDKRINELRQKIGELQTR
jgi:hypothetical protein